MSFTQFTVITSSIEKCTLNCVSNSDTIISALNELIKAGCDQIAISSVFATVRGDMEQEAFDIIKKIHQIYKFLLVKILVEWDY